MTVASSSRTEQDPASYDVAALRASEFPWSARTIYLDHASVGPLPERTRLALEAYNRKRSMPFELGPDDMFGVFAESRRLAAGLINADPSEIALSTNTSFGISIAARALPLSPGEIVLVSDREFPANVYPWMRLKDRGVEIELVPVTSTGWPDEARLLERIEDPRVRVLAVSLTQFSNGYTADLARLSEAARRTGTWLVVDAIQALGQLPFDVARTPVDILSCGAQKWLLSPWGSGFMYVRRELISRLDPAITGWMAFEGTDDFTRLTHYDDTLRDNARRFEMITLPFQDFAGMNVSLDLLLSLGIERIGRHLRTLQEPVREWARRRGISITSPEGVHGCGILCVAPPAVADAHKQLRRVGIYCSLREGSLRLSPHCYTTLDEMSKVAEVLDGLI
ncbi:MAG: aminotransferase class V-fold PLP-dependent enzyme [Gemmatimonadota bacterium]